MTSNRSPLPGFVLTPQQQTLLVAALKSQQKTGDVNGQSNNGSPKQNDIQESPLIDYDYELSGPDSSFDFSLDTVIGDLPSGESGVKPYSPDNEHPDKRSHPIDEEEENGEAKRRESEDKVAKRPGRKPLTTEPSSKRKAQNRAAQRAFRERKEKHLKDLETKVEELEKASESANHENRLLRAKVDKMTVELTEYKKRISILANRRTTTAAPASSAPFGRPMLNNINDIDFRFDFPKFGVLSGPGTQAQQLASGATTVSPPKRSESGRLSPRKDSKDTLSPSDATHAKEDLANFTSLFSPALANNGNLTNTSRTSFDSHYSAAGVTTTSSPSASSNSHAGGNNSSCGTSPEPLTQSPTGFKPVDTMTTIGEEQPAVQSFSQDSGHSSASGLNDYNWLPQDNFQFDPSLFGAYRESQENILSNVLDDSFFNDALDADFTQPYNLPTTAAAPKNNLIAGIDSAEDTKTSVPPGEDLACHRLWEELQSIPKVQSGDFDLDSLCSDLQKKAKCSGNGVVINEQDFKTVLQKFLGPCEKNWSNLSKMSAGTTNATLQ